MIIWMVKHGLDHIRIYRRSSWCLVVHGHERNLDPDLGIAVI
jgi:hypothetical protein